MAKVVEAGTVKADERGVALKAYEVGPNGDVAVSNAVQTPDDSVRLFNRAGAIEPPYPASVLAMLLEHSNSLRQNIDAYCTNIDGFGHRFEPVIDFDATDADQRIAMMIWEDRVIADGPMAPKPTAEEVAVRKATLVEQMRMEKLRLERFFAFCSDGMSFVTLRRRMRADLEIQGNAYWEVLRNGAGEISEFVYIPAFTVRLLPSDKNPTDVMIRRKKTDLEYEEVRRRKNFRRYVQVFETRLVYFKEFGDPRVMSSKTGKTYASPAALAEREPNVTPATEVIHFKIHSPRSAYGVPRWVGALLSVLGSRQAEEINFSYFDNKSIPPMALLVSGGHLATESVNRIQDFVEKNIKGRQNFHKILIIEAESDGGSTLSGSGSVKVEFHPLTDAQQKDALFQNYDERSMDKIGMAFRLPRLLRGDARDFNRATADASLDFAEQQVFAPEREEFDFTVNRKILAAMGVRFWNFKSNSPSVKDPEALAGVIKDLVVANVLTPGEARELAEGVFNKALKNLDEPWTRMPVQLTLAGVQGGADMLEPFTGEGQDEVAEGPPAAFDDVNADGAPDARAKPPVPVQRTQAVRSAARLISMRDALYGFLAAEEKKRFLARKADEAEGGLPRRHPGRGARGGRYPKRARRAHPESARPAGPGRLPDHPRGDRQEVERRGEGRGSGGAAGGVFRAGRRLGKRQRRAERSGHQRGKGGDGRATARGTAGDPRDVFGDGEGRRHGRAGERGRALRFQTRCEVQQHGQACGRLLGKGVHELRARSIRSALGSARGEGA